MAENFPYRENVEGLDLFLGVCRDLGLKSDLSQSRFELYRSRILRLCDELLRLRSGEEQLSVFERLGRDLPRYLVALAESQDVSVSVPFLMQCRSGDLIPKLKMVLSGPELPTDEDVASNQARNIQFELSLACNLWRAGLTVELAEPDLRCEIEDKTLFFACKRIFSQRKLTKRINEATVQLRRAVGAQCGNDNVWGMIAISLSSVLGDRTRSETIANRREGMNRLRDRIDNLINRRAKWNQSKEAQGILFVLTSMFTNLETSRIESGNFFTLHGSGTICEVFVNRFLRNIAKDR